MLSSSGVLIIMRNMSSSVYQNFAAQYDGVKAPDPGPGPMVSGLFLCLSDPVTSLVALSVWFIDPFLISGYDGSPRTSWTSRTSCTFTHCCRFDLQITEIMLAPFLTPLKWTFASCHWTGIPGTHWTPRWARRAWSECKGTLRNTENMSYLSGDANFIQLDDFLSQGPHWTPWPHGTRW